jgi:hypothetical protein
MGYISFEDFLKLPNRLLTYIISIRKSDALLQAKKDLSLAKDKDVRKKLSDYINELEAFFYEQQRHQYKGPSKKSI